MKKQKIVTEIRL